MNADRILKRFRDEPLRSRVSESTRNWVLEEFTSKRLAEKTARV